MDARGTGYPPYPQSNYPPSHPPQPSYYPPKQDYPAPQPPTHQQQYPGAPPAYSQPHQPVHTQQQQTTTTTVVTVQPRRSTVVIFTDQLSSDNFLTLSIILSVICCFCSFYTLLCTLPAVYFALSASDAERRGDIPLQRSHRQMALGLDIAAVAVWGIFWFIYIILIATY